MGRSARGVAIRTSQDTHGTRAVEVLSFAARRYASHAVVAQSAWQNLDPTLCSTFW